MQSMWMLVAALLFAVMGACVKLAVRHYGIGELVLYRSLFGVVGLYGFARVRQQSLATAIPWMHLRRGAVGTLSLSLWFFATSVLPLGSAMTLNYASSLYLAAFIVAAALVGGRRVDWALAAAVGIGFGGVVMVLQPSLGADQSLGALAGLASGVFSAVAYWHVRELGQLGEPEWRTVFYFSLSGVILGLSGALLQGFSSHTPLGVLLLLAVGATALLAQLAMTRAYGAGRTLLTANLQFSAIVFATGLGVIFFADRIPLVGWLGIATIIGSGILATWLASRAYPGVRTPLPAIHAVEE